MNWYPIVKFLHILAVIITLLAVCLRGSWYAAWQRRAMM